MRASRSISGQGRAEGGLGQKARGLCFAVGAFGRLVKATAEYLRLRTKRAGEPQRQRAQGPGSSACAHEWSSAVRICDILRVRFEDLCELRWQNGAMALPTRQRKLSFCHETILAEHRRTGGNMGCLPQSGWRIFAGRADLRSQHAAADRDEQHAGLAAADGLGAAKPCLLPSRTAADPPRAQ